MTIDEQCHALEQLGFTPRQTRFLHLVIRHSGVCVARQYCAFLGIARGRKVHDFFGGLVDRQFATPYPCGHRRAVVYHLHHKALYRSIGHPDSRLRRPTAVARAVERLALLDHLISQPDARWLATEQEKVDYFRQVVGVREDDLPTLVFKGTRGSTVRHFTDRLPIGVVDQGRLHIFVFLALQDVPLDFRSFLHRHGALLRATREWEIRVLAPRHLKALVAYREAFRQELAEPLRPEVVDEARWYFGEVRRQAAPDGRRFAAARRDFSSARFRSLYRAWREGGDRVLFAAASPITATAIGRGEGRFQWIVSPHQYLHLEPLMGTA